MKPTNIYIVDDSFTIRAMMQSLVEQDDAFNVCGLAGDVDHAIDDIDVERPDIVLLDLALPTADGLSFLDRTQTQIHDPLHAMKVIVVSASAKRDATVCADAFARGAVACFDKSRVCAQSDAFLTLLHEASRGEICRDSHWGDAVTLPELAQDALAAQVDAQDESDLPGFMPPPTAPRLPSVLTFI